MIKDTTPRGYTLIELIVSVAIFSIVMLVAGAAFLALINLDRQARATNDVVTNLSYVVDSMARSIRTGTAYRCSGTGDCWSSTSAGTQLTFTDASGRSVTYRRIVAGAKGSVQECITGTDGTTCMALTDPRINVERLDFYVRGTATKRAGDATQPTVVFTLRGSVAPDARSAPVTFVIESGATQRLIDL
ncbi:MAG TPA: type II secretion system protein [Candidatus Paceibacterota bacterium]|jgi:prepilin-type N-terminal cleavage/methylation domain-containing protein